MSSKLVSVTNLLLILQTTYLFTSRKLVSVTNLLLVLPLTNLLLILGTDLTNLGCVCVQQQVQALVTQVGKITPPGTLPAAATPKFVPFYSTSELWNDYWARFCTKTVNFCTPRLFCSNPSCKGKPVS